MVYCAGVPNSPESQRSDSDDENNVLNDQEDLGPINIAVAEGELCGSKGTKLCRSFNCLVGQPLN